MRVLVCGGRDYKDWWAIEHVLSIFDPRETTLIHGACISGADRIADSVAHGLNWKKIEAYPADWAEHGRAAGPIRNKLMLTKGKPDVVIVFPGGAGTNNMMVQALKAKVHVLRYEQNFRK